MLTHLGPTSERGPRLGGQRATESGREEEPQRRPRGPCAHPSLTAARPQAWLLRAPSSPQPGTGAQHGGWGACGARGERAAGASHPPTDREPLGGLGGHLVLPGDGLPQEVGWRSSRCPPPQIARHPRLKPNWAGPGATEPGKGPESTVAPAALTLLPTHHLTPGPKPRCPDPPVSQKQ